MGYKTAGERRAYMKARRIKLKERGVCVDCSKRPADADCSLCAKCKAYRHRSKAAQLKRFSSLSLMAGKEARTRVERMLALAERCA
jgi:hypothetical protein